MHRRLILLVSFLFCAAPLVAQSNGNSDFTIGPRLSNYSTHITAPGFSAETSRQTAFGLAGDYRTGMFVLDFSYDHDPDNGVSLVNLVGINTGDYQHDKGEVGFGGAIAPVLDIVGGVRWESFRVGGAQVFGYNVGTDLDMDNQAVFGGLKLHTAPGAPLGFYILGRGYLGSAKFNNSNLPRNNSDTKGYRGEAALVVPIGESQWTLSPGVEYDHLETNDYGLRFNTNRVFLNFLYHSRRR